MISASSTLGRVGLSLPLPEICRTRWDAIIVGAGHNGLTAAAYLARAGRRTLVLEARDQVGGACTLEEVLPGVVMSPCAYVVGLFHPVVMQELGFRERGFTWFPAESGMFVPFPDGSSVQLWDHDERCEAEIRRFAPQDLEGWRAMGELKRRLRDKIRPEGKDDLWLGPPPSRQVLEDRLGDDDEARGLLFEWSMAEFVERYLCDEKLKMAYLGQGVIGTHATPHDPGTASIHFHHASGRMDGRAGTWGYVKGGMGQISFLLCDIARESGAAIATGLPVARIVPQQGVELAGGERISAPVVVCNTDPKTALRLLGNAADDAWRKRVEQIPMRGCTVKVNLALKELPNFKARPGTFEPHHRGQVNTPLTPAEWKACYQRASLGHLPPKLWTELYFHTAYDPSVSRDGIHTMSVFAQYVPYQFSQGDWDQRRIEVYGLVMKTLAEYCTNLPQAVLASVVMGPPDIEKKMGLTGGHIFQGEILPQYMWDKRLSATTPMPGFFLCGSAIHPGGSVIGVNGRNAAMEVLSAHADRP